MIDSMTDQQTTASGPPNTPAQTVPLCTRCKVNPRGAGSDTNPWCNECRAAHKREYEQTRLAMKERHGYALGVSAMRDLLALEFDRLGFGMFSAVEVRDLILQAPGPKLPD